MSHVLPRKPVPGSLNNPTAYASLPGTSDSTDSIGKHRAQGSDEALSTAQPLARRSHMLGSLMIDLLTVSVSMGLFTFAVTGYCARDQKFTTREQKLLDTARIIGTAFPFVFAFIIGRLLQNMLQWRLEKSVDGLSLAYLSRSFTLGSAYAAPLRIRVIHWLPPVLLILWALSPLGSQASLLFIYKEDGVVVENSSLRVHYAYPRATWDSACAGCYPDAHNAIFLTPFLSPKGLSSQDTWNNVKIPLTEDPTNTKDGWVRLSTQGGTQYGYSSLVGIPSDQLYTTTINMTFTMESWYWEPEDAELWDAGTSAPLLQAASEYNGSTLLRNYTGLGNLWQFALPANWIPDNDTTSVPLTFEMRPSGWALSNSLDVTADYGTTWNHTLRLELKLKHRPVELNVTCAVTCYVTEIRRSELPVDYLTVNDMIYFRDYFLTHFRAAFPSEHPGTPYLGGLEAYLAAPFESPYTVLQTTDLDVKLRELDAQTLAERLCEVLNSYWIVDNFFEQAAGAFNASDPLLPADTFRNSSVTTWETVTFLRASGNWFGILCLSTLTMVLGSVFSAVLVFVRLAPDSLDFLSALSLHGEKHVLPGHHSHMGFEEKARLYRDVRFCVGDLQPDEKVGQVVIGQDGELGALQRGRLYI